MTSKKEELKEIFKEVAEKANNGENVEPFWEEVRKCYDKLSDDFNCKNCEFMYKFYGMAWEFSKKDNWTVNYSCEVCGTNILTTFKKIKN